MKKTIIAITFTALMLTGCANDDYSEETAVTTVTSASETEASVPEYNEVKVTRADELYDVYPVKFSYKNENWWSVIDTNPIEEEPTLLYNDLGMEMGTFKADYPQITDERLDETVREKINAEIKNYRDGLFERAWKRQGRKYVRRGENVLRDGAGQIHADLQDRYRRQKFLGSAFFVQSVS